MPKRLLAEISTSSSYQVESEEINIESLEKSEVSTDQSQSSTPNLLNSTNLIRYSFVFIPVLLAVIVLIYWFWTNYSSND